MQHNSQATEDDALNAYFPLTMTSAAAFLFLMEGDLPLWTKWLGFIIVVSGFIGTIVTLAMKWTQNQGSARRDRH